MRENTDLCSDEKCKPIIPMNKNGCLTIVVALLILGIVSCFLLTYYLRKGQLESPKSNTYYYIPQNDIFVKIEELSGFGWRIVFADSLNQLVNITDEYADWIMYYEDAFDDSFIITEKPNLQIIYPDRENKKTIKRHSYSYSFVDKQSYFAELDDLISAFDVYIKALPRKSEQKKHVVVTVKDSNNSILLDTIPNNCLPNYSRFMKKF